MKSQHIIITDVLHAIFRVAKSGRTWSRLTVLSFLDMAAEAFPCSVPKDLKSSTVKLEEVPFLRATSCTTLTACSS